MKNKFLDIKNNDFDKFILTLSKSAWLDGYVPEEETIIIIERNNLKIIKTKKYDDSFSVYNNLCESSQTWILKTSAESFDKIFILARESSMINIEMCDAIPAQLQCFKKNKKVFEFNFDEDNFYFNDFLSLSIPDNLAKEIFDNRFIN